MSAELGAMEELTLPAISLPRTVFLPVEWRGAREIPCLLPVAINLNGAIPQSVLHKVHTDIATRATLADGSFRCNFCTDSPLCMR